MSAKLGRGKGVLRWTAEHCIPDGRNSPEESAMLREECVQLLQRMGAEKAEMAWLVYGYGYTAAAAGRMLGVNRRTAAHRMARARRQLMS